LVRTFTEEREKILAVLAVRRAAFIELKEADVA
jgi:hypothetical protein